MTMHTRIKALLATLGLGAAAITIAAQPGNQPGSQPGSKPGSKPADAVPSPYVLGYTMNRIDGTPEDLSIYKGKVILIVNVASKCGLTPQYDTLQTVYETHKDKGFVILGFPANNFMGQEPGTNEEIASFCRDKYDVDFPMFEKVSVKGKDATPLFAQLASFKEPQGGEPSWNFTKYLVDKQGNLVARFGPRVKPDDKDILAKIDELLKAS